MTIGLGLELQKLVLNGCDHRKINLWAEEKLLTYFSQQNDNDDYQTILKVIIHLTKNTSSAYQINLGEIVNALINSKNLTKLLLGWKLKENLDACQSIGKTQRWFKGLVESQNYKDIQSIEQILESINFGQIFSIYHEDDSEIRKQELVVLAHCLMLEEHDPYDRMQEIIKTNYSRRYESSFYDIACGFLDLFQNPELQLERDKNFHLAIEHFTLSLKEWDPRTFNELGITYGIRARDTALSEHIIQQYHRLAIEAFEASVQYFNNTQAYFNLGLEYGKLADLDFDKINLYESAAFFFNKAVETDDMKALCYLSIVYEILGSIRIQNNRKVKKQKKHNDISRQRNYNLLAIQTAKKAIKNGWHSGFGIIGNAYRNLGKLAFSMKNMRKYLLLAISNYEKTKALGNPDFQNELDEVIKAYNDLVTKLSQS